MRWSEVNYLVDGYYCTVVFDTKEDPGNVLQYDGKIVAKQGKVPYIQSLEGTDAIKPPRFAVVTMLQKSKPSQTW